MILPPEEHIQLAGGCRGGFPWLCAWGRGTGFAVWQHCLLLPATTFFLPGVHLHCSWSGLECLGRGIGPAPWLCWSCTREAHTSDWPCVGSSCCGFPPGEGVQSLSGPHRKHGLWVGGRSHGFPPGLRGMGSLGPSWRHGPQVGGSCHGFLPGEGTYSLPAATLPEPLSLSLLSVLLLEPTVLPARKAACVLSKGWNY